MSKYDLLWERISQRTENSFTLTFDEIASLGGVPVDHSFLNAKKELIPFGFQVKKISMKTKSVIFEKISE